MKMLTALSLGTLFSALLLNSASAQENWARFRGPNGEGISDLRGLPTSWSESDYEWVVTLPGKGNSSPVVWEKHLFVTSGEADGLRELICLDATTGQERWKKSLKLKPNHLHKKNSYGSGTPVTDGLRVYTAEADPDHFLVTAYDFEGKQIWQRDLGSYASSHGIGISPIIYKDLLIVPNDQDGPSSIEALDRATGKTLWSTERKVDVASYASPLIINLDGQDQIVVLSSASGLAGLDPLTGAELWTSGALPQRTVASPIYGNGLLIATCGQAGRGVVMVAVAPGRNMSSGSLIHGTRQKTMPYVPTPLILGHYMYLWNDDGVACCVDMREDVSSNVWRQRIGGNYSGSPVIVDKKIYCISEDGDVKVIDASPTFREYPGGKLGDQSYSTPAVANGRMYLRGFHKLASLKAVPQQPGWR